MSEMIVELKCRCFFIIKNGKVRDFTQICENVNCSVIEKKGET